MSGQNDSVLEFDVCEVARVLTWIVGGNAGRPVASPSVFDGALSMPMTQYIERIALYTEEPLCVLVAVAYCNRVVQKSPNHCPTIRNVHRLVAAAVYLASKFTDDICHSHSYMSECARIDANELRELECKLCQLLECRLYVGAEELGMVYAAICEPRSTFWACWFKRPEGRNFALLDGIPCAVPAVICSSGADSDGLKRSRRGSPRSVSASPC